MTIATFYADVRAAIGRGASTDAQLPAWAQEAINLLENEHTFQWMKKTLELPIVPGVNSHRVALPHNRIKAIDWVKYGRTSGAGSYTSVELSEPLQGVDSFDIISYDNGTAGAFFLDGANTLVLDARAASAATLYVHAYEFTDWPDDDTQTPTVLARHYHGFKAHFMMTAAANLRDATLGSIWSGVSQRGVQAMLAADGEMEWKSRRNLRVGGRQ